MSKKTFTLLEQQFNTLLKQRSEKLTCCVQNKTDIGQQLFQQTTLYTVSPVQVPWVVSGHCEIDGRCHYTGLRVVQSNSMFMQRQRPVFICRVFHILISRNICHSESTSFSFIPINSNPSSVMHSSKHLRYLRTQLRPRWDVINEPDPIL